MSGIFSNAWLLWFLPLAALPVLLHLVTRYRLRTVTLSTYRFLMEGYVQQRRRLRLLEWLLLLLRIGVVLLIVFALSRPHVDPMRWLPGAAESGDVVLMIDVSPSMALRTGGTSSLERAQGAARQIVERLHPDSRVVVIAAGARPEVLVTRFASRRAAVFEAIDGMTVSAAAGNMDAVVDHLFTERAGTIRYVYLITDAHRGRWRAIADHAALGRIDAREQVTVIDVGPTDPVVNLAVTGEVPEGQRPVVGLPVLLGATVVNTSRDKPADTDVSVTLDGKREHRFHIALAPAEAATRRFTVTPDRPGMLRGQFTLPGDAFRDDDTHLFCLNVAPRIDVLVVAPSPVSDGDDPALFLRTALQAPTTAARQERLRVGPLAEAVALTRVAPDALTDAHLEGADVTVLVHAPLDAERSALLRRYADAGGGVLVLAGPGMDPQTYQAGLLAPTDGQAPPLRLEEPVGRIDDPASFASLADIELGHPVLAPFAPARGDEFATARLYRYFPITVSTAGDRARSLMRVADGASVLAEAGVGLGRVMVAGFGASPVWSNVPLKPPFVPVVLRAVAYLRRPDPVRIPAAVAAGEPAVVRLSDRWSAAQVEIIEPGGKPHLLDLHRSGRELIGALPSTHTKGHYRVQVLPRAEGAPESIELGFAVNLDAEPSAFEKMGAAEFRALFDHRDGFHFQRSAPDDPMLAGRLQRRREIWRWLIVAMFTFVFCELFLATLRPERAETGEVDAGAARRAGRRIGRLMDRAGVWVALPRPRRHAASPRGQP